MRLRIQHPDFCHAERRWVVEQCCQGWVQGIDLIAEERSNWCIQVVEDDGSVSTRFSCATLELPDLFLAKADAHWLESETVPAPPFPEWQVDEAGISAVLAKPAIPVLFGEPEFRFTEGHHAKLSIDIFGTIFFLLSRYEEAVVKARDSHNRVPADACATGAPDYLFRPLVDEYRELLWGVLRFIWPHFEPERPGFRHFVTCDVDNPYESYVKTWRMTLRRMGRDILRRHELGSAWAAMRNRWYSQQADYRFDLNDNFDWLMRVNERANHAVTFFFLADNTVQGLDGHYNLEEPRIQALLQNIHARGHHVGLHGSYSSYNNVAQLCKETDILRMVLQQQGISQSSLGVRQHYLRWSALETPMVQAKAGLAYDTTLSFADRPGFRCGTCHAFTLFDLAQRQPLGMVERPLVLMECSVIADRYLGLGYSDTALQTMLELKSLCQRFHGEFTLLWHNNHFKSPSDREFYLELLR